jgi:hypothetical protein
MAKTPKPAAVDEMYAATPEVVINVVDDVMSPEAADKVLAALFDNTPVDVPTPLPVNTTALDTAITQLRTLHIDSSTSEGISLLYVRNYIVDVFDELRALLLQR